MTQLPEYRLDCKEGCDAEPVRLYHLGECPECGLLYRDHPYCRGALDWDGEPFLHVLCNGIHAKL